jgi:hypothetical protein
MPAARHVYGRLLDSPLTKAMFTADHLPWLSRSSLALEMITNEVRRPITGGTLGDSGRHRDRRQIASQLISLDNIVRDQPTPAASGLTAEAGAVLQRWNVGVPVRENPQMWSGKALLAAIAAEHALGSPQAERMVTGRPIRRGAVRFHRMDHFDGYIIR